MEKIMKLLNSATTRLVVLAVSLFIAAALPGICQGNPPYVVAGSYSIGPAVLQSDGTWFQTVSVQFNNTTNGNLTVGLNITDYYGTSPNGTVDYTVLPGSAGESYNTKVAPGITTIPFKLHLVSSISVQSGSHYMIIYAGNPGGPYFYGGYPNIDSPALSWTQ